MLTRAEIVEALKAAFPIMMGYVGIGLPCGIMEQQIGLDPFQCFIVCFAFYSGAGQFMIPGMWLAGAPMATIIASVSAVNTRQILYSASLSKYCEGEGRLLSFLYAGSVTDETFGINVARFEAGGWKVSQALLVNAFSCTAWAVANAVGALLGEMVNIPVAVGSFAMTAIFICLLCGQKFSKVNTLVVCVTFAGVIVCKLVGLSGVAIILGAIAGIAAGLLYLRRGGGEHVS
jgi:4-azaleucine resistance transporter AzlC